MKVTVEKPEVERVYPYLAKMLNGSIVYMIGKHLGVDFINSEGELRIGESAEDWHECNIVEILPKGTKITIEV